MSYTTILLTILLVVYINGDLDLIIKEYDKCDVEKTYPIKHYANFTKLNSSLTLTTFEFVVPITIDDTITVDISQEVFHEEQWKNVAKFVRKDPCMLLNNYAGNLWNDLQLVLKLPIGKCPIPKGNYNVKNYNLIYGKLPIKYVRKNLVKTYLKLQNNEAELFCHYAIVEIL